MLQQVIYFGDLLSKGERKKVAGKREKRENNASSVEHVVNIIRHISSEIYRITSEIYWYRLLGCCVQIHKNSYTSSLVFYCIDNCVASLEFLYYVRPIINCSLFRIFFYHILVRTVAFLWRGNIKSTLNT